MSHQNRFLNLSNKTKTNNKKGNSLDPNKEQKIYIDDNQTFLSNLITQIQKSSNFNYPNNYINQDERLFSFSQIK